jgi:hypothetical protein
MIDEQPVVFNSAILAPKLTVNPRHLEFVESTDSDGSSPVNQPLVDSAGVTMHEVTRPRKLRRHVDEAHAVANS